MLVLNASSQSDFAGVFVTIAEQRAGGLVVIADPLFGAQRDQIIALAARRAVPRDLSVTRGRSGWRAYELRSQ